MVFDLCCSFLVDSMKFRGKNIRCTTGRVFSGELLITKHEITTKLPPYKCHELRDNALLRADSMEANDRPNTGRIQIKILPSCCD